MRNPRILKEGAIYHVKGIINRGENIFQPDIIKSIFMNTIRQAKKKYNFSIRNFCIMEDHIHFIIKPGRKESLSRIMQWILSKFAMIYNHLFKLYGHVWYGRFKSKIIDGVKQFADLMIRINEHAVRAKLVKYATDYKFCGLFFMIRGIFDIIDRRDTADALIL